MSQIEIKKDELKKISILISTKNYSDAISKAKILIERFPNDYVFYNILSVSLMNIEKYEEALEVLNKAIKLDKNNIHILNNLGLVHGYLSNYKKATEYYDRVLKVKPNFLNTLINKAQLKEKLNLNNDAVKILKTAINYYPDDYFLNYTIAVLA